MTKTFVTLALWAGLSTAAQAWPEKPITLVVPNAAGGAADNLARSMAEELGKRLKTTVVVENVAGASGALGAQKVLRAPADGYTLLFGTTSDMVVTPVANTAAGYTVKDFTPIARVGITPMTLMARPGLGVTTVDQLVTLARSKPGAVSIGVTGNVSLQAFGVVALTRAAGIDLLSVPYKGGAPLANDLLGGQLDLALMALPGALPHARSGKLQALGVLAEVRAVAAPELPTVNESQAVKGVSIEIWAAIAGPSKLPPAVVDKLNAAVRETLLDKDFSERRAKLGDMPVPPTSAAEFGRFLLAEEQRYTALASGLKRE
ncbi:MAG: tripartite tricarboxylate transporter substrate binding protein [Rubrivivax sp.]|nr:tripartite tricarboxylate transporter substrate binding protein [Rubrivivax sp.]